MKYNALAIKKWIMTTITPSEWVMIISKALPELLKINAKFSAFYVVKDTLWDEKEVSIIRNHLKKLHNIDLPEDIIKTNGSATNTDRPLKHEI